MRPFYQKKNEKVLEMKAGAEDTKGVTIKDAQSYVVKQVVDILQDKGEFQKKFDIKTNEVYGNGSLKQAITVPGNFNIDLVLFSESFTTEDYLANNGYPEKLEEINKHISERKT
ncbi:uncharacterized protein LOC135339836 [Halichondria panicea]|uniref:uncharacterized protein LOC135339836 n=1 Tax=Halichondria panicea TaxID=6063 RepID=UPI00312B731F